MISFTITTGLSATRDYTINSNSVYPISTYTGFPVTLSVDTESIPVSAHNDFFIFSINNAFLLKQNNSVYNFPYPGVYKITLFTADLSGEPNENFTAFLTAYNYVTDIINPSENAINNVYNSTSTGPTGINSGRDYINTLISIPAAQYTNKITVYRYNSWQLCYSLSAYDYPINLYCQGSNSNDYEDRFYYSSNWYHLLPYWQFRDENKTTIIRTLSTDSTDLYLTYNGYTGSISTLSSTNSLFVGTSGSNAFYFKDDKASTPLKYDKIYLTQKLRDVPFPDFLLENKYLTVFEDGLPIINNSSTYFEINVDNTTPYTWSFTNNGYIEYPLPNIMFNGSYFPLFVAPADSQGNILKYYGKMDYIPQSAAFGYNTFKLALLSATGTKDSSGNNILSPTNFKFLEYKNNEINTSTLSTYYAGVLSATLTDSFKSLGVVSNFYLSSYNQIISEPFCINPVILSAYGLVIDTDGYNQYISGVYLLNYYPSDIIYNIMKINENFDYVSTLKSYALMPTLRDQTALFDDFFAYVGGTQESSPNEIGKKYYEKIANFASNNADVDGANINELYSLFNEINYQDKNYNIKFPADLQRMMDLLSINYSKLIGSNSGYNGNYRKYESVDVQYSKVNLGAKLTENSVISAGTNIVINQFFGNLFTTVTPTIVPCNTTLLTNYSAANPNSIDITFNGLSAYPLSGYQSTWSWGLPSDIEWNSVSQQYEFYLQTPTNLSTINKQDSYIDWNNNLTTLSAIQYNSNLLNYFTMSGGLMEQYLGNIIRKGVDLIE